MGGMGGEALVGIENCGHVAHAASDSALMARMLWLTEKALGAGLRTTPRSWRACCG